MARRIVGIALLRNEEHFATWALANAAGFCDELLVVDNGSTDATPQRVEALRSRLPGLTVHRTEDPNTSHRFIQDHAGQDVWVFGVDGDEVYDPGGLTRLRSRILDGEFDGWWRLAGHMLHATRVDVEEGRAEGYTTPPTPSVTKLYNFGALQSWREPRRERLHGHNMVFRKGWSRDRVLELHRGEDWESCDLRALHLCFFPRSPADDVDPVHRPNPAELRVGPLGRAHNWIKNFLRNPLSRDASYKVRRYRRGTPAVRDIRAFGRPGDWAALDPRAGETERLLRGP